MSEHELWNELGNLYFLSGFKKQAVHAYKKSIQLNSDFGKPYSNLALLYTEQEQYEAAINLYKKGLVLLADDVEKAIAWNRLGGIYRKLKDYEKAVCAYQCANELLLFKNDKFHELSDQMFYVSSESESLSYEVVEDRHDIQDHHANFTLDVEPEFNETLPELVSVEAEFLVENTHDHTTSEDQAGEIVVDANPLLSVEVPEMPGSVVHGSGSPKPSNGTIAEKCPQLAAEVETSNGPERDSLIVEPLDNWLGFKPDNGPSLDNPVVTEDTKTITNVAEPTTLEINANSDHEALSADFELTEPIAQAEEDSGALPVEFAQTIPEKSTPSGLETDVKFTELVPQAKDELSEKLQDATPFVDNALETGSGFINSLLPINDEADINGESNSDMGLGDSSRNIVQDVERGTIQGTDKEAVVEEEKLTKQIEINPRSATTWEALGSLYKTAGRYEEAVQAFKQAISIAPGEASYHHNLGLVYAAQGNNKDAYTTFQRVLELNPEHSLTHASLGGYYKKIGLDQLAEKHIGKAMKQIYASENEYNCACLEAICGNNEQAINLLRIAIEKKQTYVEWILRDPDLDSLREDERFKQLIADFSYR